MHIPRPAAVPPAILAQVMALLEQGAVLLRPHVTPLTPAQRRRMLKTGAASVAFVAKARNYVVQTPDFRPVFLPLPAFVASADALTGLAPLVQLLAALHLDADSTLMTTGSGAYAEALMVYQYVKMLAERNVVGAQAAYDDLRGSLPIASGRRGPNKPRA